MKDSRAACDTPVDKNLQIYIKWKPFAYVLMLLTKQSRTDGNISKITFKLNLTKLI
jgi:hypothetical protein